MYACNCQARACLPWRCAVSGPGPLEAAPGAAQAGAAALLALAPAGAALANEFDLLSEPRPTSNYVLDDAGVLNKTTKKSLNYDMQTLEVRVTPRLEPRMRPDCATAACWHKTDKIALQCKLQTLEVHMPCPERRTTPEQALAACHAGAWRRCKRRRVAAARQLQNSH